MDAKHWIDRKTGYVCLAYLCWYLTQMSLIAYILTALLGAVVGGCIASDLHHRTMRSIYLDLCAERLRRERWKKWAKLWHRRRKARSARLRTWVGCRN